MNLMQFQPPLIQRPFDCKTTQTWWLANTEYKTFVTCDAAFAIVVIVVWCYHPHMYTSLCIYGQVVHLSKYTQISAQPSQRCKPEVGTTDEMSFAWIDTMQASCQKCPSLAWASDWILQFNILYSKLFERGELPPLGNHGLKITYLQAAECGVV
jgi:hypothetical protein